MDSSDSSSFGGKDGFAACCPHRFFRSCKYIWNYKCEVFVNVITAKCEWQLSLNTVQLPLSLFALHEWIWNRQYDGLVRFFELWGKDGFAACCSHRFFRSCKYIWNYKCNVFVNVITAKCEWQLSLNTVQLPLSLFALHEWIWNRQHILMYKRWTRQILRASGAKMALLPVAPLFLQKLQVHLKLQMRSICECDYS